MTLVLIAGFNDGKALDKLKSKLPPAAPALQRNNTIMNDLIEDNERGNYLADPFVWLKLRRT